MDPDRLLRACIVVVLGDGGRWVNFEDMVGRARALVEAVDKACAPDPPAAPASPEPTPRQGPYWRTGPVPNESYYLISSDWGWDVHLLDAHHDPGFNWVRLPDLDAPARPDPLPLLCQAYQAMNAHARDMLRVHGCHESAGQLRDAADAIAAAYPEVMNDD